MINLRKRQQGLRSAALVWTPLSLLEVVENGRHFQGINQQASTRIDSIDYVLCYNQLHCIKH